MDHSEHLDRNISSRKFREASEHRVTVRALPFPPLVFFYDRPKDSGMRFVTLVNWRPVE
jgi:hypothetical protein